MSRACFVLWLLFWAESVPAQQPPPPESQSEPAPEPDAEESQAPKPSPLPPGLLPLQVVSEIDTTGVPRPPLVFHEGVLIVVSGDGVVETYRAESGEFLWKLGLPGEDILSPPQPTPDGILLALRNGKLLEVKTSTGEITRELDTSVSLAIAPLSTGAVFYLATTERELLAYDSASEQVLWRLGLEEPIAALAKGGDRVIVSGSEQTLTGVDAANGEVRWALRGRAAFKAPAVFDAKGERLCIGDQAGTMYSISAKKGKVRYRWETGASIASAALVEEDRVYVVSYSNTLLAYRAGNGHEQWRVNLPGRPASGPVRANRRIVVATQDGYIVEVDPVRGRQEGQPYKTPTNIRPEPSFRAPYAAVTMLNGQVLLLVTAPSSPPETSAAAQ